MNTFKAFLVLMTVITFCHALTYNISGVVKDSAGKGIAGATVRLGLANLSTATDSDGSFLITGTAGVKFRSNYKDPGAGCRMVLDDGRISFNATGEMNVVFYALDIKGKVLYSYHDIVSPGHSSILLPRLAGCMHIFHIILNNEQYTIKSVRGVATAISPSLYLKASADAKAVVQTATIHDALFARKEGYLLSFLSLTNPDTSGITLTLSPLITGTVTDIDGNIYRTVKIGNQEWTAENLKTTRYNDGTRISLVTDSTSWFNSYTGEYCIYNNSPDSIYQAKWGMLYNWYAVGTGKLSPAGWHVPTDAEWDTLYNYLTTQGYADYTYYGAIENPAIAKSMAAKTDWNSSESKYCPGNDMSSNNACGFSALPSGSRTNRKFEGQGSTGWWWSATRLESDGLTSGTRSLECFLFNWQCTRNSGLSVRLVKDN